MLINETLRKTNKKMKEEVPQNVRFTDFDEILEHVGGWNVFQWKLLVVLIFTTYIHAFVDYSPILYMYTPNHWCHVPENYSDEIQDILIPIDKTTRTKSQCLMYDPDSIENITHDKSKWKTIKCTHGWQYNLTGYFTSITTKFDWVCDESWKPQTAQSIYFIGGIIGTLIFGWVSDHFGRVWTIMMAILNILITGIATPFVNGFVTFAVLRFLMGLSYPTFLMSTYMLTLEYVSIEKRSFVGNLALAIGFPFGGIIQPWVLKAVKDWTIFHHIFFSQTCIFLIAAPWVFKESSRWLISKGKINEAIDILEQIAKQNGKEINVELMESYRITAIEEYRKNESEKLSMVDLFKTPNLRKNIILMVVNLCVSSLLFEANYRNIENVPFSLYWTYTIYSILEIPSNLAALWGLEALGRRWSAVSSLAAFAIMMLISIPLIDNELVITIFGMVGRFFAIYSIDTAFQLSLEVVPTHLRGQGNALANASAQIANFFAPQIVYSSVFDPRMPFILMSFGGVFGATIALFLPETAGTLPFQPVF